MIELTLENFEKEVLECDGLVLVDWWGETCELCLAIMPTIEQLESQFEGKVKFTKFNASQKGVKRFCISHRIMGLPTVSIFKDKEKVGELTKEDCTKENIEALISNHL